jgi:hypothetical protein
VVLLLLVVVLILVIGNEEQQIGDLEERETNERRSEDIPVQNPSDI